MKYIIDRIEGKCAVCEAEDMSMVDIPLDALPPNVKAGTYIEYKDGFYSILDSDSNRTDRIKNLMDNLWN